MNSINHEVEETNLLEIFQGEIFRAPSPVPRWMEVIREVDSEDSPGVLNLTDYSQLRARLIFPEYHLVQCTVCTQRNCNHEPYKIKKHSAESVILNCAFALEEILDLLRDVDNLRSKTTREEYEGLKYFDAWYKNTVNYHIEGLSPEIIKELAPRHGWNERMYQNVRYWRYNHVYGKIFRTLQKGTLEAICFFLRFNNELIKDFPELEANHVYHILMDVMEEYHEEFIEEEAKRMADEIRQKEMAASFKRVSSAEGANGNTGGRNINDIKYSHTCNTISAPVYSPNSFWTELKFEPHRPEIKKEVEQTYPLNWILTLNRLTLDPNKKLFGTLEEIEQEIRDKSASKSE